MTNLTSARYRAVKELDKLLEKEGFHPDSLIRYMLATLDLDNPKDKKPMPYKDSEAGVKFLGEQQG